MCRLFRIALLVVGSASAQAVSEGVLLLKKVEARAKSATNFRAEIIQKGQMARPGMIFQDEVRVNISSEIPLKMRRENSVGDRTLLVCDGTESFYSGDGHSYYRNPATLNSDCALPLVSLFQLGQPFDSVSIISNDHVRVSEVDRACIVVHTEWRKAATTVIRDMCIDPEWNLILRDVTVTENKTADMKISATITFISYESDPSFSPETFHFTPLPDMKEAKPPI